MKKREIKKALKEINDFNFKPAVVRVRSKAEARRIKKEFKYLSGMTKEIFNTIDKEIMMGEIK